MALTSSELLRQNVGEAIPSGGTEGDTLFTNQDITDFLSRAAQNVDLATYYAWVAKAAALANMADTQEGQSRLGLSKLHDAALKQIDLWAKVAGVELASRQVRSRRIVRT